MTILTELKSEGWHLSNEGLDLCSENVDNLTVSTVIKRALDMDLRDIGGNFLPDDLSKGKIDSLSGPGVVQIQKVKNASAPKYEYGSGAPPILRLLLTDGNNYVNCLQWGQWKSVSMDTPPGTKLLLRACRISVQNNFLLLREDQFTVLGGCVAAMVDKWELCRQLASHIRAKEGPDGGGPPPWIPFGRPIVRPAAKTGQFRSLESEVKESKGEDAVFRQQRQANIAEVSRVKEAKARAFGGRKEKPSSTKPDSYVNTTHVHMGEYNENDAKRFVDVTKESPSRNRPFQANNRGRKNPRNEHLPPRSSSNVGSFLKDSNKLENKNKLGDFILNDVRHSSAFPVKSPDSDMSSSNNPQRMQSRVFSKDPEKMQQRFEVPSKNMAKIFGYEVRDGADNVLGDSSLRPGMEVMAKYWEDNQYYRAVIHAVGKEGRTCVVHFLDYGNYEEVLVDHVQEKSIAKERNWNVGPITFQPTPRSNYERLSIPNYRDSKGHNRQEYRPSAKIYQPPSRRDTNS